MNCIFVYLSMFKLGRITQKLNINIKSFEGLCVKFVSDSLGFIHSRQRKENKARL